MTNVKEEVSKGWRILWWSFKLLAFPITISWLMYHFYNLMQFKRRKSALRGKVVMITGASSGLGEAMAHVFYNFGCKVILVSRRKEELENVKHSMMKMHPTIPTHPPMVLPLDITDINNLQTKVDSIIEIYGQIDILINNAGISYRGEVVSTSVDVDIKVMLTNYFAQIALTKAVLPFMIKQRCGHIVCISSVQGKCAIPHRSAYSASKHALQAWCDSCRAELADKNIKVSVISPGYIRTDLSLNALTGNGQTYGVMDKTTEKGYAPDYVAYWILRAILNDEKDVVIATLIPRLAVYLRTLCPSLYFWIMHRRARKAVKET